MFCPHCGYEPTLNEYDWCEAPGRFFELQGHEMVQEENQHSKHYPQRETVYGCPRCGILFMNMGYTK